MLRLLLGRAGCGKSGELIRRVCTDPAPRRILIVPEQFSHEAERRLCEAGGSGISLRAEVLSFTRLAGRVLSEYGGLADPTLDAGGRMLLMYCAVKAVSTGLTVYRKPSGKPAFLTGLLDTLDECKSYQISPAALSDAGEGLGGVEGDKLRDLGLIFAAYGALCDQTAADPRDLLTRAATGLKESGWAKCKAFYLDGFTDFTPQEQQVISALLAHGESVTVALTCDGPEGGEGDIFAPARQTAAALRRLARRVGAAERVEVLPSAPRGKAPALDFLEANLFAPSPEVWDGPAPVELFEAETPWSEVEWVAARIRALVRTGGLRYREIAVAARGMEEYEQRLEDVFRRYDIPLFLSKKSDILEKPVLALVTAALDTVAGGYARDDLFRYLKTGLTNLSLDRCDILENYALLWDVKGNRFTQQRDWTMHPRGVGQTLEQADEALLRALNALRREAVGPLEALRRSGAKDAAGHARALYGFLEAIGLEARLTERADGLRRRGELRVAEEYRQLWEILVGGLEQCVLILGDTEMELAEFARLFALLLSQYDVGSIPVSLDRVTAGEASRVGYRHVKALFVIGADDGSIPATAPTPGLLTDRDRLSLAELGLTLAPRMEEKLTREMTIVYTLCAAPTEHLAVSWPAAGGDGVKRQPAFLIPRLRLLFPALAVTRERESGEFRLAVPAGALERAGTEPLARAALDGLPEYAEALRRLDLAVAGGRGRLSRAAVGELYGSRVALSATRMDKFQSCRFAYFMQYGLRAAPRRRAVLGAPEYGTFVHFVLETVLPQWVADRSLALEPLVHAAAETYAETALGGLEDKSARVRYLFARLERAAVRLVQNVTDELAAGEFAPLDYELGFGAGKELPAVERSMGGLTVSLTGFVDRVDGWEQDGTLYLRVVDYKTGRRSFELADIQEGLGLQTLLYLFALEQMGPARYGKAVVPAGALYLPARAAVVTGSRRMSEDALRREVDKQLQRSGMFLRDDRVLNAMERQDGGFRFLPLRRKKDGETVGELLVSLEQMGRLNRHMHLLIDEIGQGIAAGSIDANPIWRGPDSNACRYCDFGPACQFREGRGGDRRRWPCALPDDEFWKSLQDEEV